MNFKQVCRKQMILDKAMHNIRMRDDVDIQTSAIAECVELNEELGKWSHKTWKSKMFNEAKVLDECVDILFFITQYANKFYFGENVACVYWEDAWVKDSDFHNELEEDERLKWARHFIVELIQSLAAETLQMKYVIYDWVRLAKVLGFNKDQVLLQYEEKHKTNLKRIGAEWN